MISFLFILVSLNGARAQGHGIGNGGGGFQIESQVYLRDLVEVGFENRVIVPELPRLTMKSAAELITQVVPLHKEKLATFLSDVETIAPGVGEYLSYAIRMHQWSFVYMSLQAIEDHCSLIQVPNGMYVQIANRLNSTIRIDFSAWQKMSDENRIALIMHEAIYSLITPRTVNPGECQYAAMKTREIVGILFAPDFADRGATLFKNVVEPEMDWPRNPPVDTREDAGIYSLNILRKTRSGYQEFFRIRSSVKESFSYLLNLTGVICYKFIEEVPANEVYVLRANLALRPFEGEFVRYDAGFGEQFHLKIKLRENSLYQSVELERPLDFESCKRRLRPLVDRAPMEI